MWHRMPPRVGSTGEAVYALCKGGMIAFSKTMAREHLTQADHVNVVCPGPTDTALFADFAGAREGGDKLIARVRTRHSVWPTRSAWRPDLARHLLSGSDDAAFITGQVISVSGGLTMIG
jgi:2-hydroxycyclohexanecarboxyl-CoA dehydrogenase